MSTEYESPFAICPGLQEGNLEALAQEMLKVVEQTLKSNTSELDDNYTFETTLFGRMRQLFLRLHRDKSKPWLCLASESMDYVPIINNVPVRVFKDDPNCPKKVKLFYRNECEQEQLSLLFEEDTFEVAGSLAWRLLIEAPATADNIGHELEDIEDDYHVVLVGYHPHNKTIVSMWRSASVVSMPVRPVDEVLPAEKKVERKRAVLKLVDTEVNVETQDE